MYVRISFSTPPLSQRRWFVGIAVEHSVLINVVRLSRTRSRQHSSLKAENLLVDSKGRLQLSDFGWAVHAKPPHQHIRRTMCGTPEYAPPEILVRHPEYTKAVDIWSLGVLSFELLTGLLL